MVQLSGRNGNENVSNDGPKWSDGDDRGYGRKGVEQPTLPSHTRVRDELVRGKRVRPFRLEGNLILHFDSGHHAEVSTKVKAHVEYSKIDVSLQDAKL